MVSVRLITISSPWPVSVFEKLIDSIAVGWTTHTGALGSPMGAWTLRLYDTRSAESSLIGAIESAVVYRGPRSRASPTVNEGGRKLVCRMSMYDRNGLSTSKAWLNGCQVEYIGLQPSIRWDARSYPSVCTKISDLSTKLGSLTCTTLRSGLNLFPSVTKQ